MYNPIEYIINFDDPRFNDKVKTVKHHFPPGVKVLNVIDMVKDSLNLKNVYLDADVSLDGFILPVTEFKTIKFLKNNNFEIID